MAASTESSGSWGENRKRLAELLFFGNVVAGAKAAETVGWGRTMITDIQNLENAARIATADALFFDADGEPRASVLGRWFEVAYLALAASLRGIRVLRQG